MAEPVPNTPAPAAPQAAPKAKPAEPEYGHIPLTEEMDRAKWTLPPWPIVLVGIAVIAVIGGVLGWFTRYQPVASGTLGDIYAIELADHASVLASAQITVRNDSDKPIFIHSLQAELKANGQTYNDVAATEVDDLRYFEAFPDLKQHATTVLKPETRILPHQQVQGTMVFGFPVTKQQFDGRQSLDITVEPYDRRSIIIAEHPAK